MTFRIIVEPTAEREIRSAVRWKTENSAPSVAARWKHRILFTIRDDAVHVLYVRHSARDELEP
jgi:plasmid stabilization system protein ParE